MKQALNTFSGTVLSICSLVLSYAMFHIVDDVRRGESGGSLTHGAAPNSFLAILIFFAAAALLFNPIVYFVYKNDSLATLILSTGIVLFILTFIVFL